MAVRERFFLYCFVFIIFFSVFAYGSTTLLPLTVIEGLVGIMLLLWSIEMAYKRNISFLNPALLAPLVIFFCLMILQLIPLPQGLVRLLSGKAYYLFQQLLPQADAQKWLTLSIYPMATQTEILKLLTYSGLFFLILNKIDEKRKLDLLVNSIIICGLIASLFGIIQKWSYSGKVYWFDAAHSAASPFGPFVNRNNFAGYINMVIPLAIAYLLTDIPFPKKILYSLSIGIMGLALFLSLSRAGIFVFALNILFILLLSRYKERLSGRTKGLYVWFILAVCLLVVFGDPKIILARFASLFKRQTFVLFGHGYSWLDILKIWRDFPIFGTGLGTFANISSMYKSTVEQSLFIYAHNDYLQLLAETGIVGAAGALAFVYIYFYTVLKRWSRRHRAYNVCLALGGLTSLFGMLVYSLLDFNLRIPANSLLFFMLMGLVYCLVFLRFTEVDDEGELPKEFKQG